MIIFQTLDNYKIDLTNFGLNFNEASPHFTEKIEKNYSLPFHLFLDDEIALKLGLANLENITGYQIKIDGFLIVDSKFYTAYLQLSEIVSNKAETTLFYGSQILGVFDKKLNQLPWPVIDTGTTLPDFAQSQLSKEYPAATHNFAKVHRPAIKEKSKYELFELFVNNYSVGGAFITNSMNNPVDEDPFPSNKNVMAPMPYLMEILRLGFATENLELRGEFPNDDFCKKILTIPKNYFEEFTDIAQRDLFSFIFYDSQETIDGKTINVYTKTQVPTAKGTYFIKYNVDFPKGIAEFFELKITYGETVLFSASATNDALILDDTVEINITEDAAFENITTTLKVSEQINSIEGMQRFVFDFKDGTLNVFPKKYTLADFVPDMTFKTFLNIVKKWANLDIVYHKNAVYLNYLDNSIKSLSYNDNSEMEEPDKKRQLNQNNLFKLRYPDDTEVLVNKTGQVYNQINYVTNEIESVELEVLPLKIIENEGIITGEYPEEENDLMIGLFTGLHNSQPVLVDNINTRTLSIKDVYTNWHKIWLKFRTNSEIYKDTFFCHVSQPINFREGIIKYNKKHLVKTLKKTRVNEDWWKIDMETESF